MDMIYGVEKEIHDFVVESVDKVALKKVRIDKLEALSKKLAYSYCQSHRSEYWSTQKKVLDVLRRLRCKPEYFNAKE